LRVGLIDDRPLLPLAGAAWRSCRFRAGDVAQVLHAAPDGPVRVDLPDDLRQAVAKRRSEFLAGRLCAALALRALGAPETVGRRGRAPVWPAGVRGSITHTAERAIAVASGSVLALGLDCERLLAPAMAAEIAPLVLTEAERRRRPPGWDEARFLTLAFSAKEALYKALAESLAPDIPDFKEAAVERVEAAWLALRFRDRATQVRYTMDAGDWITLAAIE